MESTEQKREMKQFDGDQPSVVPAVVSCVAGVVGLLVIAASPWLLLNPDGLWTVAQLVAL